MVMTGGFPLARSAGEGARGEGMLINVEFHLAIVNNRPFKERGWG